MTIKKIRDDLDKYLKKHNLEKKYKKAFSSRQKKKLKKKKLGEI